MALLSVIRRWHFREGMPIREIERRTGLSRNTIRKYLRAGTVTVLCAVELALGADVPTKTHEPASSDHLSCPNKLTLPALRAHAG